MNNDYKKFCLHCKKYDLVKLGKYYYECKCGYDKYVGIIGMEALFHEEQLKAIEENELKNNTEEILSNASRIVAAYDDKYCHQSFLAFSSIIAEKIRMSDKFNATQLVKILVENIIKETRKVKYPECLTPLGRIGYGEVELK